MREQINPRYKEVFKNIKLSNEKLDRRKRAYTLLEQGKTPIVISEEEFLVPSQFDDKKKYKVSNIDGWTCECPDFKHRNKICKHIQSIQVWLKIKNSFEVENLDTKEDLCPKCRSVNIVKRGVRKNKSIQKQRYYCKDCKHRFVLSPLKYVKGDGKLICLAMDMYFKGMSLRDIEDNFKQFHNINVHFDTIRRWIRKFTKVMNDYVTEQNPELGKVWHVDEQEVKSKGKWKWSWNILDSNTRFLIANTLTKGRKVPEARLVFKEAKENTTTRPSKIVSDGLQSYHKAIKKEFKTHQGSAKLVKHQRNASLTNPDNCNNIIERYHNEFREFDKVRRGFKSDLTTIGTLTDIIDFVDVNRHLLIKNK